jgi:hypothetical protein
MNIGGPVNISFLKMAQFLGFYTELRLLQIRKYSISGLLCIFGFGFLEIMWAFSTLFSKALLPK